MLARHPKDLDKKAIKKFIGGKKVLITGAGVLLAKLAEKDPQQEEEQSMEGNHREKDAFQEKEFDDIW